MKKSIVILSLALSTGIASAAHAETNRGGFCTQLSADIAARSALFSTAVRAMPEWAGFTPSTPAAVRQRAHDKEVVLNNIANEIWTLRTQMAYLDCAQASSFSY